MTQAIEAERQRLDLTVLHGRVERSVEPGFVPVPCPCLSSEDIALEHAIPSQRMHQALDLGPQDGFIVLRIRTRGCAPSAA